MQSAFFFILFPCVFCHESLRGQKKGDARIAELARSFVNQQKLAYERSKHVASTDGVMLNCYDSIPTLYFYEETWGDQFYPYYPTQAESLWKGAPAELRIVPDLKNPSYYRFEFSTYNRSETDVYDSYLFKLIFFDECATWIPYGGEHHPSSDWEQCTPPYEQRIAETFFHPPPTNAGNRIYYFDSQVWILRYDPLGSYADLIYWKFNLDGTPPSKVATLCGSSA
eukprot:Gregarina_sp_Pseudo_9__5870@NODE_916_length_2063_cov_235_510870_g860_i0_p2_GENE_NODE_916_length_2063_cov_235_510870_g860_i0NODE_916_length_2063_cov_235_510870_g860_i0_p2_ORF_typecomplete_len225_score6_75CRA/PF06589_11/0_14_NODE_916_length_2063_cov_235_510870_g860_i011481822